MAALLALLSSVLWGTSDFLGGTMSRRRPPLAVVGFSQAAGLLVMVVVVLATGAWGAPLGYLPWAILAASSGLIGLWTFYSALATGTMGVVSPIAATGIVVPLGAGLLVGDLPSMVQAAGVVVAIVGLGFVVAPESDPDVLADSDRALFGDPEAHGADSSGSAESQRARWRPIILAGISALMFGTSLAAIAQGSLTSPTMTMAAMRVWSVTIMVLIALFARSVGGMTRSDLPAVFAIGAFDVGANMAYGFSAAGGELVIAAVLGSLYPVVTVILAWRIHGERLRAVQYAGVGLALVGVVLMSVG